MSTEGPEQVNQVTQQPNTICENLRIMAEHYRDILKILVWSELIVGFFVTLATAILFFVVVPNLQNDQALAEARRFQSLSGVLAGSVTTGVLEFLRHNRKKDLNEVHRDMVKFKCHG